MCVQLMHLIFDYESRLEEHTDYQHWIKTFLARNAVQLSDLRER